MNKSEAHEVLTDRFGYPYDVATDLCIYFSTQELADFIEFLEGERG